MSQSSENHIIENDVPDLPHRVLSTYARLWQFETWLRRMAYVELRARDGDEWSKAINGVDRAQNADSRLTHMPTPETDPLSFTLFSRLLALISDARNWDMFTHYLPPKSIWEAKMEELTQIRNRVAHFRKGHVDDLQRVRQLLRDIDKGFWHFCTSFNDTTPVLPQNEDPVTMEFLELDPFPYTQFPDGSWGRVGSAPPNMNIMLTVELSKRPWATAAPAVDGSKGYIYSIHISARNEREMDYSSFLEVTKKIHPHLIYICLDTFSQSVGVTFPAVLGAAKVIDSVRYLYQSAQSSMRPKRHTTEHDDYVQNLSEKWPEFVLGPENPLTFLGPDMACPFFAA